MLEGRNERSKHQTLRKMRAEIYLSRSVGDDAAPNALVISKLLG
jgi:hypothetical protein